MVFIVDIPKNLKDETYDNIVSITQEFFLKHFDEWEEAEKKLFPEFLANGDDGIACVEDGKIAAHAWTQILGDYTFAKYGKMRIPPNAVVFKNLLVRPEFRGRGIAGIMDRCRLQRHKGKRGIGYILTMNRFAFRNWEKNGMKIVGKVTVSRLLKKPPTIVYESLDPEGDSFKECVWAVK